MIQEKFAQGNSILHRLDPADEVTRSQFLDAAEHFGNWVEEVPAWFDWDSGLYRSMWFGADGVKVGIVICFEGFRFAQTTRECVRQGAQLIFQPQNNTTRPNDWKIPIHHAMIVTRAAENTVWFASCNACYPEHQNCRTMVVAPDGRVHGQLEMKREGLLVSDIDIEQATRAMFEFDLAGTVPLLFADTVAPEEYASALTAAEQSDI